MLLEEMMMDERKAGRAEGLAEGLLSTRKEDILKILSLKGFTSDDLTEKINMINEVSVLDSLFEAAIASTSLEEFCKNLY